jgi:hypothetical protein
MKKLLPIVVCVWFFASCKKQTEELQLIPISDYAPLTVGKYITYSLDSLVFINFNLNEAHRLYEVKYLIADSLRDNLGRKAFRIVRYKRNLPSGTFASDNTFMALNNGSSLEFTENNLRYLKLAQPIKEEYSWKGNSAIDVTSNIDNQYLFDWDYTYAAVGQAIPTGLGIANLTNTITVNQRDVSSNLPVTPSTNIASKDFSQEIYAKDIGMVYRKFIHWEYQSGNNLNYNGYGITLKMIDHN